MFWRKAPSVKASLLSAAALLLLSAPARAGKSSTAPTWPTPPTPHVVAPVARAAAAAVIVSVAVTPPRAAKEVVYVNLRGPDGVVRRFPVEGGREAIRSSQVIVLRPGASVTVRWVVTK
jgi:hypothetical protein